MQRRSKKDMFCKKTTYKVDRGFLPSKIEKILLNRVFLSLHLKN